MTSKERFLKAMRNQVPDRVPVSPDTSNYIPCKFTKLPFWDIYFFGQARLWEAYLDVTDHFGCDPWVACNTYLEAEPADRRYDLEVTYDFDHSQQSVTQNIRWRTPDGDLTARNLCFRSDPPSPIEKPIKDIVRDFPKYRWLIGGELRFSRATVDAVRDACAKRQCAFGVGVGYPGFHAMPGAMDGGLAALSYAEVDHPEIIEEWNEILRYHCLTATRYLLEEVKPDYLLFGGSGTLTLASPELVQKYVLPTLKEATAMTREAGVATVLHSCGKSRLLVDMFCEETQLDCINPLEIPPMGDVDLAELKAARGSQIALMGNLHTTEVMLKGSAQLVKQTAIQAMRDAGQGGGFILSTGDQCGLHTPDANLAAMVEAAVEFGQYDQATGQLTKL